MVLSNAEASRAQPKTRWTCPQAWMEASGWPANALVAGDVRAGRRLAESRRRSECALVELLLQDIRRAHKYVAIRHYLMLLRIGARVPEIIDIQCALWLKQCPQQRLARIESGVVAWADLSGFAVQD